MSYYTPSSKTRSIQVLEPEYPTSITLTAPSSVEKDAPFTISGMLTYFTPRGEFGLAGQPVDLSYNGNSLGRATTTTTGSYSKSISIPNAGSFTLRVDYTGAIIGTKYAPSQALIRVNVGLLTSKEMLVPLLVAVGLLYYALKL